MPILDRLADARRKLETLAVVAVKSGLAFDFHLAGAVTAARLLSRGKSGPSTLYRIHGANTPDKPALIVPGGGGRGVGAIAREGDSVWTFGALDATADRFARGLRRRGLGGKTVLVMMKNRPEYLLLGTGASRVGVALVTISWRSTAAELAYLANHCGASAIVFDATLASVIDKARPELKVQADRYFAVGGDVAGAERLDALADEGGGDAEPLADATDEGAVVVYTSGTTGKPKGAVRKFNKELLPSLMSFLREAPFRHDDVHLAACPLYHTTAFGFIGLTYVLGGTVVLLDEFEPRKYLEAIARYKATTTVLVPTMLHRLLALGDAEILAHDTRSLRALFTTSAPLPGPDSDKTMELLGDIVWNLYGSTETGIVTVARPEDVKRSPGTIGRAVAGNEIRLLDEHGREVADGAIGELFTRNAMLVAGYHEDATATAGSMRDGHFSVGDLARRDARGCYHLEGRKRDMIISGGVNVYPAEVEACLEAHPDVDEVAVVGAPDPEWGERVQAVLVLRAGHGLDDPTRALKAWCKERLMGPKVPREFVFLPAGETLPRNATGKVLKRELRARSVTSTGVAQAGKAT